jgi:hypothetical protein
VHGAVHPHGQHGPELRPAVRWTVANQEVTASARRGRAAGQGITGEPWLAGMSSAADGGVAVVMASSPCYWAKPAGRRVWKSSNPTHLGRTAMRAILVPGWSSWAR